VFALVVLVLFVTKSFATTAAAVTRSVLSAERIRPAEDIPEEVPSSAMTIVMLIPAVVALIVMAIARMAKARMTFVTQAAMLLPTDDGGT